MQIKNFDDTLERILLRLSDHCLQWRLNDMNLGRLTKKQRCALMGATLDFLERSAEREHRMNAENRPGTNPHKGTAMKRSIER